MMMKGSLLKLLTALLLLGGGVDAFEVDFSRNHAEDLFGDALTALRKSPEGLIEIPSRIETRSLPIEAGRKYRLEIGAQVPGLFVVETNERCHILTLQSHRHQVTGTYEVVFLDANGNDLPPLGGVRAAPRGFFLSNQLKPYIAVFYTPEDAAALKVKFQANGSGTRIASLQLTEERAEETINPNPDFRYGELNYSGWQPQRDGRLYTRPDGKTVLNAGYGGMSPYFPLYAGKKYHISIKGEGKTVNIEYYDKNAKFLLKRFLIRPEATGAETELTPPAETVMARIVMYGEVILEDFKVIEVQ